MRFILLLVSLLMASTTMFGQAWTKNLPENKSEKELTLYDYQKAFNDYWSNYNLERGYIVDDKGEKRKAPGWKQYKRWEYYWETAVDLKTGEFPNVNPLEVYQKWQEQNAGKSAKGANWTVLGPSSSGGGYAGIGRINTIAFHPTNTDRYWIGAASGGVWETTDNGNNWEVLTDNNPVLGISDILVSHDFETSSTIYIATGDRDAWDNNSVGVLKSTDEGATWEETGLSFNLADNAMVTRLLQDPNDAQIIVASTSLGVYKTTDGGENWTEINSLSFIDMEYKPGDYSTIYGSRDNGKVYTSTDGGETFTESLYSMGGGRIELAITLDDPTKVYAISCLSSGGLRGIYRSDDSGVSFTEVFDGTESGNNLLGWQDGGDSGGQGWYDLAIAASPNDADVVLIGGVNTWKSTDGGTTWDMENHWYGGFYVQAVHADKHMLTYRDNGDLFECNDGGVYISQNDGNSGSWYDKTDGMEISQIYRLGVSATDSDETIIGLQDNGTKLNWNNYWSDVKGGDGMECIIDYTDVNTQYGSSYYGAISRTTNHWGSDTDVTAYSAGDGAWVTPYIIDPVDHETLYAGYSNVWKTTNQGANWTKISSMNSSGKLRSLAIAESDPNVIYAADLYSMWKTEDGGDNWSMVSSELPYSGITYITIKHDDPQTVWITFGGYNSNAIYETTDGGSNWTNISGNMPELPASSVVENKQYEEGVMLFVSTEVGVYMKIDNEDWVAFNDNLPNVRVDELEIYYDTENPANSRLRAATYGRGLWETPILLGSDITFHVTHGSTGANIENAEITIDGIGTYTTDGNGQSVANLNDGTYFYTVTAPDYQTIENESFNVEGPATVDIQMTGVGINDINKNIEVYPNPVSDKLTIKLDGQFKATIYNESGQIMINSDYRDHATINVSELSAGIYFLELKTNGNSSTQKLIVE